MALNENSRLSLVTYTSS